MKIDPTNFNDVNGVKNTIVNGIGKRAWFRGVGISKQDQNFGIIIYVDKVADEIKTFVSSLVTEPMKVVNVEVKRMRLPRVQSTR